MYQRNNKEISPDDTRKKIFFNNFLFHAKNYR